ncbi:hypothetical protein EF847_06310 [Actinobacteria bacterium YIM 96077]|nr:hypothetical protein EF847_06310 [Actinobacteria bacterium YIM 96077]
MSSKSAAMMSCCSSSRSCHAELSRRYRFDDRRLARDGAGSCRTSLHSSCVAEIHSVVRSISDSGSKYRARTSNSPSPLTGFGANKLQFW